MVDCLVRDNKRQNRCAMTNWLLSVNFRKVANTEYSWRAVMVKEGLCDIWEMHVVGFGIAINAVNRE